MTNASPVHAMATFPARVEVASTDDRIHAFAVTLPSALLPTATITTIVLNHLTGADVSATVKNGAPTVSGISGSACTIAQRLFTMMVGTLYRLVWTVTASTGEKAAFVTFVDCVA